MPLWTAKNVIVFVCLIVFFPLPPSPPGPRLLLASRQHKLDTLFTSFNVFSFGLKNHKHAFNKQTGGRTVPFLSFMGDILVHFGRLAIKGECPRPCPPLSCRDTVMPLRAVENPEAGSDVGGARGRHFLLVDQRYELRHTLVLPWK